MDEDKLYKIIDALMEKYKGNEYIKGRISNYIENLLPVILENEAKVQKQREERKQELTTNRDEFTERFMHKNNYSYCLHSEMFLIYDGLHFKSYSEDNIYHQIVTTIAKEKTLLPWKYKIKNNILKQIREKSPLKYLPESATIQFVLNNIYPKIFSSRNHAKYFLTIIGDCLLKKTSQNLVYIASSNLKEFIREIENQTYTYFGISNAFQSIKFKHYEHDYKHCRLLYIADNSHNSHNSHNSYNSHNSKSIYVPHEISKYMLDLFCVATHYSTRYGYADKFLEQCNESSLVDNALYLNNNTLENIVNNFIETAIHPCTSGIMKSKNMIFVWKKFLEERNVPNIVFYETLKGIFRNKMTYDEDTNSYLNVTSVYLPVVSNFIQFWEENMKEDDTETELEMDEIGSLFKNWLGKGKNHLTANLTDSLLIELIRHLYQDVIIEEDKYILNMSCLLWNKRDEVINSLEVFRMMCMEMDTNNESSSGTTQSLYMAYEYYSENNKNTYTVSKRYFEKIAREIIDKHVDEYGVISSSWWK